MKFCKKCLYPDTKPQLTFDDNGVCDACRWAEQKENVDWDSRKKDLSAILEKYRSKDGSRYDCLIPVSGGKDSHFQAHIIKNEFGLNPHHPGKIIIVVSKHETLLYTIDFLKILY